MINEETEAQAGTAPAEGHTARTEAFQSRALPVSNHHVTGRETEALRSPLPRAAARAPSGLFVLFPLLLPQVASLAPAPCTEHPATVSTHHLADGRGLCGGHLGTSQLSRQTCATPHLAPGLAWPCWLPPHLTATAGGILEPRQHRPEATEQRGGKETNSGA